MFYQPYTTDDVRELSSHKKFSVISCFAGGGGSSIGYRLAGGNVLLINEFVESAVETYSKNFPDTKVLADDIKKFSAEDFLEMAGLEKGELDILDGSPPCSAFSMAGSREKGWAGYVKDTRRTYINDEGEIVEEGELITNDGKKTYSDGKKVEAIEDLFYEFIRIAEGIQPKVIVAENVKGMTAGSALDKLNSFVNEFEKIGYHVTYKVLNAADYGVPQARERTIFVCIRDDIFDKTDYNMFTLSQIYPDRTVKKHMSIKEAIDDIENDEAEIEELKAYVQKSFQKKFIEPLPFNPKKHLKPSLPEFRDWNPKGSCFNMIRPCPDLPCPTLTQTGQQIGASGVFHYAENRKLTINECKRIMGFPDDYFLAGKFNQKIERLGRAVSPPMYQVLATSIYDTVLSVAND